MAFKNVLSIAGSDPSGGAGIQADLKTFTSLGVYGGAVITCLTVQNTQKVKDSLFLEGPFVKAQIEAVLEDIDISFIKTGMLGNAGIAEAVGASIQGYYTICDPVMISKSGYPLMKERSMRTIEEHVLKRASLITPNYHELMRLSYNRYPDPVSAGKFLLEKYPDLHAVLLKGGHIEEGSDRITDALLVKGKEIIEFTHPRLKTKNTHGTGCTLSSAITAYLARGLELTAAVGKATEYVSRLIELSAEDSPGKGNGPLLHYLRNELTPPDGDVNGRKDGEELTSPSIS